jgi:hypothetical protein
MAVRPQKRHLSPKARRALELLASNPLGTTEAFMLAHGFTVTMLASLVRAGLAAAGREAVTSGGKIVAFDWIAITAAGRSALES